MARQARWSLPGHPHHILVRGNNRQPIFHDEEDRRRLLAQLGDCLREHAVALHAYVLMPEHLHLLATPSTEGGVGRVLQGLGRRYVSSFNSRHQRTGTLWEGRYRAHLVGPEEVLSCMRFIELNPQRNGLVQGSGEQEWSSLVHHLGAKRDGLVTEPTAYWSLGNTPFDREANYRAWIEQGTGSTEASRIKAGLMSGRPLGGEAFMKLVEQATNRSLSTRPRGRPRTVRPAT